MKTLIAFAFLACSTCFGQANQMPVYVAPGTYACSGAATAVTSQAVNTGQTCATFAQPLGQEIVALNQTASMASQTICDTSATCPAGFYVIQVSIEPVNLGTLVSAINNSITYTSDVRTYTNMQLGTSLSLVGSTPGSYFWTFYHAANTAVTVNTTVVSLTGSPSYNFRARINLIGNS